MVTEPKVLDRRRTITKAEMLRWRHERPRARGKTGWPGGICGGCASGKPVARAAGAGVSSHLFDLRRELFHFLIELADLIPLLASCNVLACYFLVDVDLLQAACTFTEEQGYRSTEIIPSYSARMENKE